MPKKADTPGSGKRKAGGSQTSPDSKKLKQCLITSFFASPPSGKPAVASPRVTGKPIPGSLCKTSPPEENVSKYGNADNNAASPVEVDSNSVQLLDDDAVASTDIAHRTTTVVPTEFIDNKQEDDAATVIDQPERAVEISECVTQIAAKNEPVTQLTSGRPAKKRVVVCDSSDEEDEGHLTSTATAKVLQALVEDEGDDDYNPNVSECSSSEDEAVEEEAIEIDENSEFQIEEDFSDNDDEAKGKLKRTTKLIATPKSKPKSVAPSKTPTQKGTPKSATKPVSSAANSEFYRANAADNDRELTPEVVDEIGTHEHQACKFIKPDYIRDKQMRRPNHPDYDATTLYVDDEFLKKQTPAMKQWWQIKSEHMDCILFFKMGKFYELWHMDADVGVQHLSLIYMRGDKAHAGFPEQAFSGKEQQLVGAGFKVMRVEQTETPDQLKLRQQDGKSSGGGGGGASSAKKRKAADESSEQSKCVRRQVCQISTPGTRLPSMLDYSMSNYTTEGYKKGGPDSAEEATELFFPLVDAQLLVLVEKLPPTTGNAAATAASSSAEFSYGVTLFNPSTGQIMLGQFDDDKHRSRLRTLLAAYSPVEVLYERNGLHAETLAIINSMLISARKEALQANRYFLPLEATLKFVHEQKYFEEAIEPPLNRNWPKELAACVDADDMAAKRPNLSHALKLRAFGAFAKYLEKCCVDRDVLPLKNFAEYTPADVLSLHARDAPAIAAPSTADDTPSADDDDIHKNTALKSAVMLRGKMVLDGITLRNLDILYNGSTGAVNKGSLLVQLDSCRTFFGRRRLREMLYAPAIELSVIRRTQSDMQALERLVGEHPAAMKEIQESMKRMPDLERLLVRVYQMGSKFRAFEHPEAHASMFDIDRYNKRQILDFVGTMNGLEKCAIAVNILKRLSSSSSSSSSGGASSCVSARFQQMLCFEHVSKIEYELAQFKNSFNVKEALERGNIKPSKGSDAEYEQADDEVRKVEAALANYLKQQQTLFGTTEIKYWGRDRNRYQLEIPERLCSRISQQYELKSQKKGFNRYWTEATKQFVQAMLKAEDRRNGALSDVARRIYERFAKRFDMWKQLVSGIAQLDAMLSLAHSARAYTDTCWPEFVDAAATTSQRPFLSIRNGRHPIVFETYSRDEYIPNDVEIGSGDDDAATAPPVMLITGPNMGGKSTLMRQTGLITLMAHLGCRVPAESCRLTPVDRIFTRVGASDNLAGNESTFFVELNETSTILKHATQHSLVLIDELGRGTATHDGTAIAVSVARELAGRIKCRTLFSTHYHLLVKEFAAEQHGGGLKVQLGHMSCMVENENVQDPTQENITFLYKFVTGACPKSYGFNVAKLAGLRTSIIKRAYDEARKLEADHLSTEMMLKACQLCDIGGIAKYGNAAGVKEGKNGSLQQLLKELRSLLIE